MAIAAPGMAAPTWATHVSAHAHAAAGIAKHVPMAGESMAATTAIDPNTMPPAAAGEATTVSNGPQKATTSK